MTNKTPLGTVTVNNNFENKELYIDNINSNQGVNSLGYSIVKQIFEKLKSMHEPDSISGLRISGTREKYGANPVVTKNTSLLRGLFPIGMLLNAYNYSKDPEAYMYGMYGQQLAPQGSQERDIQTGRML